MNQALGMIEVTGFGCAVNVSDVMVKTANVTIVGIERAKGSGWLTIKVLGDVGAVDAAVESGCAAAKKDQKYVASKIIPRLGTGLDIWLKKGLDASTEKEQITSLVSKEEDLEIDNKSITNKDEIEDYTCNLCKDSTCQRTKGEPRKECLHYEELREEK
ncbi:MAG: BMC domain-containing protein [Vagococcus sp.]|uniref:BMC domain-containing protein n=1 Tax=Vagococcus sp. TaxID=1933889 RepID=UPI002FC83759